MVVRELQQRHKLNELTKKLEHMIVKKCNSIMEGVLLFH